MLKRNSSILRTMPPRLLLGLCLLRGASCSREPEDHAEPAGLREQLSTTCSDLRANISRTEVQLDALQRQVDSLKHERDQVSQRLHLCEARSRNGESKSSLSSSGESYSHQNGELPSHSRKIASAGKRSLNLCTVKASAVRVPAVECQVPQIRRATIVSLFSA
jgi:seryl-tRNA synthetase